MFPYFFICLFLSCLHLDLQIGEGGREGGGGGRGTEGGGGRGTEGGEGVRG